MKLLKVLTKNRFSHFDMLSICLGYVAFINGFFVTLVLITVLGALASVALEEVAAQS